MATTLTNTTFSTTYKDDFRDSDGYHRILFNSGKALQARELTQVQTFLQNQISRFGNNIFKEGAVVKPGGANLNQKYEFIKLDTTSNSLPTDTSILLDAVFTGATSTIKVKVLQVVAATASDPATLYVQYTDTSGGTAGANTLRVTAGENLTGSGTAVGVTLTVQSTNTTANPAVGVGILATLKSGVYYARGHFVFTEDQSKIISKYSDKVDTNLGFLVVEDIVTTTDDQGLFDNQGAVPDVSAPGADRYRIRLTIDVESEVDSDKSFIHVATVKDGVIYNAISSDDAYNIPNEVVAKRIFENSGDYIVKPFTVDFGLDSENTHLLMNVSAGTAVVDGFRASRDFPTTLRIQKPTSTITINNEAIGVEYGNSVVVNPSTDSDTHGLPNINVYEKMDLRDSVDYLGSTIGTARVKAINSVGSDLKYHLMDVQLNSGKAFRSVKSIGTSTSNYFRPTLELNKAVIKDPAANTALFRLPNSRPKALTDVSFAVQRRFTATSNGGGQASISLSAGGETFTNTADWVIAKTDSAVHSGATFSGGTIGGTASTISNLPASSNMEILAYVNKGSATSKTKTLTTKSMQIGIDSDGNGQKLLPLATADIFEVEEILNATDSNESYASRFTLDNGQRDNFYGLGRLLLNPGQSAPSTNVFIRFKHFTHGVSGDFFSVNSYTGQVDYDKIPSYRLSSGKKIKLRDYIDFRSVMDSAGEFTNSGLGARPIEQPQVGTTITSDNEYYLQQAGKLIIDREGVIKFIRGTPGFHGTLPQKPDNTLALYDVVLPGNTDNDSDVAVAKIEHKRFTMKDIAQLEKRLARVEKVTSLSLLELDTKHIQTLDSAGNDRTKSGFIVDNFKDHTLSETNRRGYRASVDVLNQKLRPGFLEDNIRLIYDSASSTNTIRKGDNVYIAYDETPYINQNFATTSTIINPFSVVVYEGTLTLSPASDEWRDVDRLQDKIISGGTRLSTVNAYNWNNWSWSWGGVPVENLTVGAETNLQSGIVNRVVSEETVLDLIEDKVIQTAFIPFMRTRKVYFKAEGLRPNTTVFPILDGHDISAYAREESFQFYSDYNTDFGNTLKNVTTHPDGTSALTTDVNGSVSGSFIIPNNDSIKIRTGTRQFKILDITGDNEEFASVIARAPFTASGILDTKEASYTSTRQLNVMGINKNTYSVYQGDDGGGSDDEDKPKTDTGSWVTGPEMMDMGNVGGSHGGYAGQYDLGFTTLEGIGGQNETYTIGNDMGQLSDDDNDGPGTSGMDTDSYTDNDGYGVVCLLEDMMVLVNGVLSTVDKVKLGDTVGNGIVNEVIHKHMRTGYYIINNELKITNDHPVMVNNSWKKTEEVQVGEYINGVEVKSIKYISQVVPTVYIGIDKESFDVYCEDNSYTVHGNYKQALKKAS
tara:strand:+ start:13066 stop:17235 length:4170 start_codon:yes stop_codon:yes gene_type:complete